MDSERDKRSFGCNYYHDRSSMIKLLAAKTMLLTLHTNCIIFILIFVFVTFSFIILIPILAFNILFAMSYFEKYLPASSTPATKVIWSKTKSIIFGTSLTNLCILFDPI